METQLAVCMIVRDEAANLERCLASLSGLECTVYVTDTGSVDDTREIARRHGAHLQEFIWEHDFAAARNFAMRKVKEPWILTLDADDYFTQGAAGELWAHVATTPHTALNLRYEIDPDSTPAVGLKLFRNHCGLLYEGLIHENLRNSLARFGPGALGKLPIILHHAGYHPGTLERKTDRNLPMLEREFVRCQSKGDRAQTIVIGRELARHLFLRDQTARGESILSWVLQTMVERREIFDRGDEVIALNLMVASLHERGATTEATKLCSTTTPVFGGHPVFWLMRGLCQLKVGSFGGALADLQRFESFVQSHDLDIAVPKSMVGAELWAMQGICHAALNQKSAALKVLQRAVEMEPTNPEYAARLKIAALPG